MPAIPSLPETLAAARLAASLALCASIHIIKAKNPRMATRRPSNSETTPHSAFEGSISAFPGAGYETCVPLLIRTLLFDSLLKRMAQPPRRRPGEPAPRYGIAAAVAAAFPHGSLPALRRRSRRGPPDANAGVDRNAAVRLRDHRVQVQLGDLGQILGEAGKPVEKADEGSHVGRRCSAEAAHKTSGLASENELFRVDVRDRREPEGGVADQLREDSARAEGNEGTENRVLDDAREQLGASAHHRLYEQRLPDPLGGGANLALISEVESDAALLGLVGSRGGGLEDGR